MIRLRKSALNRAEIDVPFIEGETIQDTFDRVCKEHGYQESIIPLFEILVDGYIIDKELWKHTATRENSSVLIAITPKSGDFGQLLGQVAIIAAVVIATAYTGGMGTWAAIGIRVAAAVGTTLLVNALIKPPDAGIGGTAIDYNYADSQMYAITGQSNKTNKYGTVPRLYGTHRIFPTIAANPYTELITDENGEIVQYFYAIYDFGYGPLEMSELKIGDTYFSDYSNAYYRLVDVNRPSVDEGYWDEALNDSFKYYIGDVNQIDVSANINENQIDVGSDPESYQVTRSADDGGDGDSQEITVVLAFPRGLTTYATNGERTNRNVELNIQFAQEGTTNWRAFNNTTYVDSWSAIGDVTGDNPKIVPMYPAIRSGLGNMDYNYYQTLSSVEVPANGTWRFRTGSSVELIFGDTPSYDYVYYSNTYGLAKGTTYFRSSKYINLNDYVSHGGAIVGKIAARTVIDSTYYGYSLYSGIPYDIYCFSDIFRRKTTSINYEAVGDVSGINVADIFDVENSTAGLLTAKGNSTEVVYCSVKFRPKTTNQVKIRVTRVRSYGGYTYQIIDDMIWSTLTTRFDRQPIVTTNRHCFIEVKVKATDQLNGSINTLSAVCSSILDVYDGISWSLQRTANPAWVFADILTGSCNKNSLSKTRLDTTSLLEWADFCDEIPTPPATKVFQQPRFQSNFVLDYNATLSSVINQVTSSAQASLSVINGKYGSLVDKNRIIPVQIFTPRNSTNFSSSRSYVEMPHGFIVKYIDGNNDWSIRETPVYLDGYDSTTATDFQELDTFACTNEEQAWRYGRYMLAQALLRQENITITVDFENLVCTRGDYVLFQYDVMKSGGRPARVKAVAGSNVEIDDGMVDSGGSYGYTFRKSSTGEIVTDTMNITSTTTMTVNGEVPGVGDLIIWGEVDTITIDCIVKSISPNDDLSAQILLVEKGDAIYSAESTGELPAYSPQFSTTLDPDISAPSEVVGLAIEENSWSCLGGNYQYYIDLDWSSPDAGVVETYEIYVNRGKGYELTGYSTVSEYRYVVGQSFIDIEHSFKVIGVASTGAKLSLGEVSGVSDTPVEKTTSPSDIDGLYANILNETLQLDWHQIDDCDISYYLIRFSPKLVASWENSIPLQVVDKNTSLCSVQARTGSYYIKAVDWNGNESTNAASVITSIPSLVNLNVIEETNDFPDLLGPKDQVVSSGDALLLQMKSGGDYYESGEYTYKNLLDLGEIYEVRLSSLIDAEGFTEDDLIVNWPTLSSISAMSTSKVSEWNVETYYRSTEELNVIANWTTLSSVSSMSGGVEDIWTPWRKFTIGDYTGRIFQFKLKLISNKASVTPRVFDGIVRADMPDRTVDFNNIVAPSGGYDVTYTIPFAGPGTTPSVQVTQDAAQNGDYYVLSNKTLAGFTINFYDKNDNPVSRQFDALVKGYGRKQTIVL